jgi:hypothetical protein
MAFLTFLASPALATDYTYDISPSLAPYISRGFVVTKSDQCVLTSQHYRVVDGSK